jgi:hypothetical protein
MTQILITIGILILLSLCWSFYILYKLAQVLKEMPLDSTQYKEDYETEDK